MYFHGSSFIIDQSMRKKKKKKKNWKKKIYSSFFILSFFIGHVYGRAGLLHWVHVLERVRMRASFWDSSWCIFWVRVWVIHSIFVRETSDLSLVSLGPCSIHHSIYFGCDYFLCFDVGWPSLIFLSLCFLVSLSCSSIPPYLIWFLSFLILLDVWLEFSIRTSCLLIRYDHSFIITFLVGTSRSGTHDVFYALHFMHEGVWGLYHWDLWA